MRKVLAAATRPAFRRLNSAFSKKRVHQVVTKPQSSEFLVTCRRPSFLTYGGHLNISKSPVVLRYKVTMYPDVFRWKHAHCCYLDDPPQCSRKISSWPSCSRGSTKPIKRHRNGEDSAHMNANEVPELENLRSLRKASSNLDLQCFVNSP